MSRRGRAGRHRRDTKYWAGGGNVASLNPAGEGVSLDALPASDPLASWFEPERSMARRVLHLANLARWTGDATAGGTTTGQVASLIGLRPQSAERVLLNETLTRMRKARLLHFEFDRSFDREIRWWLA